MKWQAQQISGERFGDFYDRKENGIMTWIRRPYGTNPAEIIGVEQVPEWATEIVTHKMQVGQYAGFHPENGLTCEII